MKKRMLSAILAMSMVMGMSSVTAFAADETTVVTTEVTNLAAAAAQNFSAENKEITIPDINVTVPTSGEIVLDPFNISQKGQITSADFKVINNSQVPLTVTIKNAKAVGTNVDIVSKARKDGTKWAMVNMNIIDGLGKATTKVLTTEVQDIAVATAMAPMGGVVKYKFSGSSADVITATTTDGDGNATAIDWNSTADKVTVSNTFAFTMNSYAVYEIKKTMVSSMTAVTVEKGSDEATNVESTFPATVLGDGKEVPVTWKCVDNAGADATYNAAEAATYTFKAVVADADIYKVAENVTMPTITVTVEE